MRWKLCKKNLLNFQEDLDQQKRLLQVLERALAARAEIAMK